jgi:hypothetical protein
MLKAVGYGEGYVKNNGLQRGICLELWDTERDTLRLGGYRAGFGVNSGKQRGIC